MKKHFSLFYLILINYLTVFSGCKHPDRFSSARSYTTPVIIEIQPFDDISPEETKQVFERVKKVYPLVQLNDKIPLPATAWYMKRKRYRADSLIRFLNRRTADNHVSIGVTTKDISTSNGDIEDWGVMGLGFCPGKACIASTFRLSKKQRSDQLFKVSIHELGHTQGLAHCDIKYCFMRDAEGGNPTNEETGFCEKCKRKLMVKGWKL